jgi:hypothetical protein
MTDPVNPAESTEPPEGTDAEPKTTFDADYVKKLRAESAKYRNEAKKASEALAAIEDANKSELTKAQERAAEAEKAAQSHETTALRLQVAFDKGLTPAQAKRLVGATRDELEADADEILRDFVAPAKRPSGSVDQGPRGGTVKADPRQVFADILAGKNT